MSFKIIIILKHSPNGSCSNSLYHIQCLVYILSEHSGSQTIICLVGPVNELIKLSKPQYLLYWSKDLKKYVNATFQIKEYELNLVFNPFMLNAIQRQCAVCAESAEVA